MVSCRSFSLKSSEETVNFKPGASRTCFCTLIRLRVIFKECETVLRKSPVISPEYLLETVLLQLKIEMCNKRNPAQTLE